MLNTKLIAATVTLIFSGPVNAGEINEAFDMASDTEDGHLFTSTDKKCNVV